MASPAASEVYLIRGNERKTGIQALWNEIEIPPLAGKRVALKANYNSDDPFPASTHPETFRSLLEQILAAGAAEVTLAERSGMGQTRAVLENRGVFALAEDFGFDAVVLDDLPADGWERIDAEGLHWKRGFLIAKVFRDADVVIQTCCLKTHRFGGHVTLSLKNSVGLVARHDPDGTYDYMAELHASPHQRSMIAEINRFYPTDLIVMDAMQGFATGGPERGSLIEPGLLLASTDRVALDAVAIALLRFYGSTPQVMKGRIFAQEQIARAAELGVGVRSADELRLVPLDSGSKSVATEIRRILDLTG
ncbi:DUF362 domain-containing protein [Methanoculleus sp. FWC-SCC1]|uniref:DUF362 domain-containing protein n=1 Tax=Methanoculleus frigidifontis TaxID=2584085 RepID=A0ABT8MB56_9EURY|nr:DUF362 domain-containing protein [Methanoculleus sp. FWC-SCC1]MDN7025174.1 DUF362 domain-containing protein [Methanoculleus sp. FWC-SCC1]